MLLVNWKRRTSVVQPKSNPAISGGKLQLELKKTYREVGSVLIPLKATFPALLGGEFETAQPSAEVVPEFVNDIEVNED